MTPPIIGAGAVFIDDIVLPDGQTYMGQLGGGVVHALMGAALWDETPGLVALAGYDLPASARNSLEKHLDTRGLHILDLPQIRAWQIFEVDGTRRELYRVQTTQPFIHGAQPQHLPEAYKLSQGCYLLQDFDGVQAWRAAFEGLILWEPLQQIMAYGSRRLLRQALQSGRIDIISPNLAEARAVYNVHSPDRLVSALLEDGAQAAALRMGPEGSLVASRKNANCVEIPAVPVAQIIDQTGAGNTYCGALLAGLVQGRTLREAAVMGAVAASFCLEHRGVLQPDRISKVERDQRYRQIIP